MTLISVTLRLVMSPLVAKKWRTWSVRMLSIVGQKIRGLCGGSEAVSDFRALLRLSREGKQRFPINERGVHHDSRKNQ